MKDHDNIAAAAPTAVPAAPARPVRPPFPPALFLIALLLIAWGILGLLNAGVAMGAYRFMPHASRAWELFSGGQSLTYTLPWFALAAGTAVLSLLGGILLLRNPERWRILALCAVVIAQAAAVAGYIAVSVLSPTPDPRHPIWQVFYRGLFMMVGAGFIALMARVLTRPLTAHDARLADRRLPDDLLLIGGFLVAHSISSLASSSDPLFYLWNMKESMRPVWAYLAQVWFNFLSYLALLVSAVGLLRRARWSVNWTLALCIIIPLLTLAQSSMQFSGRNALPAEYQSVWYTARTLIGTLGVCSYLIMAYGLTHRDVARAIEQA